MEVSVRELKNRLSEYLKRVQAGEEVIVTSRHRPVARLSPLQGAPSESEVIARIRALPSVRPGTGGKPRGASNPISWKPGEKTLSELVMEDRE